MKNLPTTIQGIKIPTDFRTWMKIGTIFSDDLLLFEKEQYCMLLLFGKSKISGSDNLLPDILDFYLCGVHLEGSNKPTPKTIDWMKDYTTVWADFLVHTGIDLDKADLHWWEFSALLDSLPTSSAIKQRIWIRGLDLSNFTGEERLHYERLKKAYSLEVFPCRR